MLIQFKTKKQKLKDRVEKYGKWHEHFCWLPVYFDMPTGEHYFCWLQKINRKLVFNVVDGAGTINGYIKLQYIYKPIRYNGDVVEDILMGDKSNINDNIIDAIVEKDGDLDYCNDHKAYQSSAVVWNTAWAPRPVKLKGRWF